MKISPSASFMAGPVGGLQTSRRPAPPPQAGAAERSFAAGPVQRPPKPKQEALQTEAAKQEPNARNGKLDPLKQKIHLDRDIAAQIQALLGPLQGPTAQPDGSIAVSIDQLVNWLGAGGGASQAQLATPAFMEDLTVQLAQLPEQAVQALRDGLEQLTGTIRIVPRPGATPEPATVVEMPRPGRIPNDGMVEASVREMPRPGRIPEGQEVREMPRPGAIPNDGLVETQVRIMPRPGAIPDMPQQLRGQDAPNLWSQLGFKQQPATVTGISHMSQPGFIGSTHNSFLPPPGAALDSNPVQIPMPGMGIVKDIPAFTLPGAGLVGMKGDPHGQTVSFPAIWSDEVPPRYFLGTPDTKGDASAVAAALGRLLGKAKAGEATMQAVHGWPDAMAGIANQALRQGLEVKPEEALPALDATPDATVTTVEGKGETLPIERAAPFQDSPRIGGLTKAPFASPQDLMKAVDQAAEKLIEMAASRRPGRSVIKLNPEDLGTITVTIKSFGMRVEAEAQASNDQVRAALSAHRSELMQTVEGRGFSMAAFTVGQDQSQQQSNQTPYQSMRQEFERIGRLVGQPMKDASSVRPAPRAASGPGVNYLA